MAEDNEQQSPFTRPGFVAATVVIALIVVLGLVIVIVNMTRDDPDPAPPTSTSAEPTTAAPTSEPPEAAGGASVCGLPGEVLEGTLSAAPAAEWAFQDTTAYPTSPEFGPGETNADGVRYCFQHSPEGAVFAAANAVVHRAVACPRKGRQRHAGGGAPGRERVERSNEPAVAGRPPGSHRRHPQPGQRRQPGRS